jgi:hypothetical protein
MKLEVDLLSVPTVADSSYALRILRWLGMLILLTVFGEFDVAED